MYNWAAKKTGDDQMYFCMEATRVHSISVPLQMVNEYQARVCIVNPAQIASYGRVQMKRSKADQIDAEVIRSYAASQKPPVWHHIIIYQDHRSETKAGSTNEAIQS